MLYKYRPKYLTIYICCITVLCVYGNAVKFCCCFMILLKQLIKMNKKSKQKRTGKSTFSALYNTDENRMK